MFKHYPQYNNYSTTLEEWEGFKEALECWRSIPGKLIKALIMSMPKRILAFKRARDCQTKH
jgi:hypothetical protein